MKKFLITLIIFIFLIITFFILKNSFLSSSNSESQPIITPETDKATVSYNGWLHTNGSKLENEKNEIIQLRGLSSHGIEWYSNEITLENLKILKEEWNINVFRIAMYTDSNGQGYIFNSEQTLEKVYNIIDMAIELDIYIIIDWHILNDNNPQIYQTQAKDFFNIISKKYANTPNVIYEICNEPNGNDVTWEKDIKPYAEEIIPIIRNNSKNSLIIIGTPNWCRKIKAVLNNPLSFKNIIYACHFYAGSHKEELRESITYCLEKNIPIFISECGLTDSSGNGNIYFEEFAKWITFLNENNISWIYWSFSTKNESSAILLPEFLNNSNNNLNDYLSTSGEFIKNIFINY